jgi:hypothetical protein
VGANGQRVSLTIFPPSANAVTISEQASVTAGAGIVLYAGNQPITLDLHNSGDYCQRQLYAIATTADQAVGILEVICPCREPPPAP